MTSKDMPCRFCMSARSYIPLEEELYSGNVLTDDNDSSSASIGKSCDYHRLMLTSGWGKPVRIESETLCKIDDGVSQWVTHSVYYPKFCPECGRELKEYKVDERGANYQK